MRPVAPESTKPQHGTERALAALEREVISCRRCPRLVAWRQRVADDPPRRFRGERYWGRPLPAFGDFTARVLLVGLAPAAHGGNRTGRMFTGDESGNFLFRALHAVGFSNRAESVRSGDGLSLSGALVSAACRCAPPGNRPAPQELANCREYLARELALLPDDSVLVPLGRIAWDACLKALAALGERLERPRPRFAHGAVHRIGRRTMIGCYHPSQQNTFTGKLTQGMIRQVLRRARKAAQGAGTQREGSSRFPEGLTS